MVFFYIKKKKTEKKNYILKKVLLAYVKYKVQVLVLNTT